MSSSPRVKLAFDRFERFACWTAALCWASLLLGCAKVSRPAIGEAIDSPIALASHPTLPVSYVLNAVLGGEYDTGSLQSYGVNPGTTPQLLATEAAPRLGTAVAVAKSGSFLMAGFSGTVPEIQVYSINGQGVAQKSAQSSDRVTLPPGRIGTLHLAEISGQDGWIVVVSLADRSFEAQILVYRYSPQIGFQKLLSTPGDFYTPSRDNPLGAYSLAWGAPVVFESLGVLVAFPFGTLGYFGSNPSALDWLSGRVKVPNETSDLRTVSALIVDLKRLGRPGLSVESSIGFAPLAFNLEGKTGNPNADSAATENSSFAFRTSYQSAIAIDALGSKCTPTSPLAALAPNTAVVATNTQAADVIALGGFDQVASQLRSRLDQNERQPVLGSVVVPQPVSLTTEIDDLRDIRTLVPQFQLIQSAGLCTLSWLRVEQRRSSLGAEKSRIQIATASGAAAQAQIEARLPGTSSFAVTGSSILSGSFGSNQLQQFDFDGAKIKEGGVR